jgi:hypothetical protein
MLLVESKQKEPCRQPPLLTCIVVKIFVFEQQQGQIPYFINKAEKSRLHIQPALKKFIV